MLETKKKILLIVTQDHGGAGEYVYKLAKQFSNQGNRVALLVKHKSKEDDFVFQLIIDNKKRKPFYIKLIDKIFKKKQVVKELITDENYYFFGIDEKNSSINPKKVFDLIGFVPDIIVSGWIAFFMNSTDVLNLKKASKAEVYTIAVDMNHFTGGCHYAWDCKGYINGCSINCPAIVSEEHKNLAKINFETKLKNAHLGNFKIITGSGWTFNQASESMIYKNQDFIPNINSMIDTNVMMLSDKNLAKEHFDLEKDKFYILMGCQNGKESRKGFEYLLESLKILYNKLDNEHRDKIKVMIVSNSVSEAFEEIPFGKKHIEFIDDYSKLSILYQAVDVFVNSSIEDSGPMMVTEALACGTPVVGFDMGVVTNMVINDYNGYKAILKDANDLSKGIETIYKLSTDDYKKYSKNAIKQIREFSSLEFGMSILNDYIN